MQLIRIVILALHILALTTLALATPAIDLQLGHYETHIDYSASPGNPDAGWELLISYDTDNDFYTTSGIVRLDPATTTIVTTPECELVLPVGHLFPPGLANAGDTVWIIPQNNYPGQIFFGWRNAIEHGTFMTSINGVYLPWDPRGSIVVELIDASGPAIDAGGEFVMWEYNLQNMPEIHFNSADGLNSQDRLEPVPAGAHTHYNYGFTHPGRYEVTFRASGRLRNGGQDTSANETFHYSVPFSSVVTGEADLRLGLNEEPGPAGIHPLGQPVEYAPDQVSLVTQATEISGATYPYAFAANTIVTSTTVESHRVGLSGQQPIAFPAGSSPAADPLEILQVTGPGNLQVLSGTGDRRYFVFSESGIYRVQLRAVASDGGTTVNGPAFELVFLAGLEADYDFSAYADSFERTYGLPSASLRDDGSDFDGDNVPDIIEYQLFWEGMDPVVADGNKLPLPDPQNPENVLIFHRDTYKDRLDRYSENIILEHSADLINWQGWSDRNPGRPLEIFETGAELGNAHGRIQRRAIRFPDDSLESAFFRWKISD